jgi:hypothetical protein
MMFVNKGKKRTQRRYQGLDFFDDGDQAIPLNRRLRERRRDPGKKIASGSLLLSSRLQQDVLPYAHYLLDLLGQRLLFLLAPTLMLLMPMASFPLLGLPSVILRASLSRSSRSLRV